MRCEKLLVNDHLRKTKVDIKQKIPSNNHNSRRIAAVIVRRVCTSSVPVKVSKRKRVQFKWIILIAITMVSNDLFLEQFIVKCALMFEKCLFWFLTPTICAIDCRFLK